MVFVLVNYNNPILAGLLKYPPAGASPAGAAPAPPAAAAETATAPPAGTEANLERPVETYKRNDKKVSVMRNSNAHMILILCRSNSKSNAALPAFMTSLMSLPFSSLMTC